MRYTPGPLLKRPPVAPLAALAYAASLAWLTWLEPPRLAVSLVHVFQLHSRAGAVLLVKTLLHWVAVKLLGALPLGVLSVLSLEDHQDARTRRQRVVLPATGAALGLAYLVVAVQARTPLPNLFSLLPLWLGAGVGAWLALSARRGPRARRLIVPKLIGALAAVALLLGGAALLAIESTPQLAERPLPSSDQHRELVALLRGRDPRKIPDGETRSLTLDQTQLDNAFAWGASLLKARSRAELREGGAALSLSLPVWGGRRWLNLSLSSQLQVEQGEIELEQPELRLGRLQFPSFLVRIAVESALSSMRSDADLAVVLDALRSLALHPDEATLTYAAVRGRSGIAARLMYGDEVQGALSQATRTRLLELLPELEASPAGDERFRAALTAAFRGARAATKESAVAENRAAVVALGIVLGHPKLARILGERFDDALIARMEQARSATTVRGRNDWVRHFMLSGALTVLADVAPSDAIGLLKEELDADGGSGFSFADLLADRAGTTLAQRATESEATAQAMQSRLGAPFALEAVFPDPKDLPEGLQDAQLKAEYGGVGSEKFNAVVADIEQRVAGCELLRR